MRFGQKIGLALLALTFGTASASAAVFSDTDWNQSFIDNCGLPKSSSVAYRSVRGDRKLTFTLDPGDIGGCKSDSRPRNGSRSWERVELKQQGILQDGLRHTISFEATFAEGFAGKAETFFQIHAWSSKCKSAPLLMMQFDTKKLKPHVLQRTSNKFQSGISRGTKGALAEVWIPAKMRRALKQPALVGTTRRFEVTFDRTKRMPRMSAKMDGQVLFKNEPVHLQKCAQPHLKFGLYRPSFRNKARSVLMIDDIKVRSVR